MKGHVPRLILAGVLGGTFLGLGRMAYADPEPSPVGPTPRPANRPTPTAAGTAGCGVHPDGWDLFFPKCWPGVGAAGDTVTPSGTARVNNMVGSPVFAVPGSAAPPPGQSYPLPAAAAGQSVGRPADVKPSSASPGEPFLQPGRYRPAITGHPAGTPPSGVRCGCRPASAQPPFDAVVSPASPPQPQRTDPAEPGRVRRRNRPGTARIVRGGLARPGNWPGGRSPGSSALPASALKIQPHQSGSSASTCRNSATGAPVANSSTHPRGRRAAAAGRRRTPGEVWLVLAGDLGELATTSASGAGMLMCGTGTEPGWSPSTTGTHGVAYSGPGPS